MITGIGTDIVDINRIAASIGKEKGFREIVFSAHEIDYCETKANKFEHYAARFAAKEAFFKAIGTGWKNGTAFHEVEVYNDELGKPHIRLTGTTATTLCEIQPDNIQISLSHAAGMAIAMVLIQ